MKGIMFNILEDFICENWGDEKYEEILALCPLKTKEPYVGPGSYPDSDLTTIAAQASDVLGVPLNEALRLLGAFAFTKFAEKFPEFIEHTTSARDFLLTVDSVIHVEVKKLYPDAVTPKFSYQDLSESQLIIVYRSHRRLCALMEGLIDGVANHFGTKIQHIQRKCVCQGHAACEFDLRFLPN